MTTLSLLFLAIVNGYWARTLFKDWSAFTAQALATDEVTYKLLMRVSTSLLWFAIYCLFSALTCLYGILYLTWKSYNG